MTITNAHSGTNVHEIADGIYRINTPIEIPGGPAFSFNQYLLVDDEPLLFHTGMRRMFPLIREAVQSVLPIDRLAWIGFSHFEADECGSLNDWLAAAPRATPVCGKLGAMLSIAHPGCSSESPCATPPRSTQARPTRSGRVLPRAPSNGKSCRRSPTRSPRVS